MPGVRSSVAHGDEVYAVILRAPFAVLLGRGLVVVTVGAIGLALPCLPIAFVPREVRAPGLILMLALFGLLCLAGAALLAAPLRPLRVSVTRTAVCFGGLAGPAPRQIALCDILSQRRDHAFRIDHVSLAFDKVRYVPYGATWVYTARLSAPLLDHLRTYSGVRLELRGGGAIFIETPHAEDLAHALSSLGITGGT